MRGSLAEGIRPFRLSWFYFRALIAPQDRVLLIGDTREHQGVEVGWVERRSVSRWHHGATRGPQLDDGAILTNRKMWRIKKRASLKDTLNLPRRSQRIPCLFATSTSSTATEARDQTVTYPRTSQTMFLSAAAIPKRGSRMLRRYLSLSPWKLRQLIQCGKLPVVRDTDGSPFLLDVRDLDGFVERSKRNSPL